MTKDKKVIIPVKTLVPKGKDGGACPCGCCGLCCK